jgi:hypothetical protein
MFWNELQSTWRSENRLLEHMLSHDSIVLRRKQLEKYVKQMLLNQKPMH